MQFHESPFGHRYYNKQLPDLIKALNRLADVNEATLVHSKEKPKVQTVYVCYHENSRSIAMDAGGVSDLTVKQSIEEVYKWAKSAVEQAENDGFVPMCECEATDFFSTLLESPKITLPVYKNGNEDAEDHYVITVERFLLGKDEWKR